MRHRLTCAIALLLVAASAVPAQERSAPGGGTTRPPAVAAATPRIPPLPERQWTTLQRDIAEANARVSPLTNDVRTWLAHPDLVGGMIPFVNYITRQTQLPARDRALLILRTAWLSRSPYLWAKQAPSATTAGLTSAELAAVATSTGEGLAEADRTRLQAADELHRLSFVTDETWRRLSSTYGKEQLIDAVFTVAEMTMLAGVANSAGTPIDPGASAPAQPFGRAAYGGDRAHPTLAAPRIPPLAPTFWTGEIRAMLDPDNTGRPVMAVYRTFAQHPALYAPRQILSEHIRQHNTLPPRAREMVMLRIGYLCDAEYEWSAHAPIARAAGVTEAELRRLATPALAGWNAVDMATFRAVDELYANDRVSDATWKALAAHYDTKQLLDLLVTAGGYRMVSMALNAFGVPFDAENTERFPR